MRDVANLGKLRCDKCNQMVAMLIKIVRCEFGQIYDEEICFSCFNGLEKP